MYKREKRSNTRVLDISPPQIEIPIVDSFEESDSEDEIVVPQQNMIIYTEHDFPEKSEKRDYYYKKSKALHHDRNVKYSDENTFRRNLISDRHAGRYGRRIIGNIGIAKGKWPDYRMGPRRTGSSRFVKYVANMECARSYDDYDERYV